MEIARKISMGFVVWCIAVFSWSQTVTLDECQRKAEANYPAIARYGIIEKTRNFNLSNAGKAYLPQGSLGAQATWQNDVTKIELKLPQGFPPMPLPVPDNDQYRVIAEINQLIWDGGTVSAQKKAIKAGAEVEKEQLQTELYALRERVNNLYFGIMLMKENLQQLAIMQKELQRNYQNVTTYIENGVANEVDLSTVKVEQLKSEQQEVGLKANLEAYVRMLAVLTGENLTFDTQFEKPEPEALVPVDIIRRPELKMFEAQRNLAQSQQDVLSIGYMPKLVAFAQGGYGKPGLNMFNNAFEPIFIGGLRLSWNFSSLYTLKNDRKKIELQKLAIDTQQNTFLHNLKLQIPQHQIEIEKFRKTMQTDDEILRHQTMIRKSAEVKVENGMMSVSDLMKEINAEEAARQNKTLHEIQYLMSVYSLKNAINHQ